MLLIKLILTILTTIAGVGSLFAETPSRFIDGKLDFAYGTINGRTYWNKKDYDNAKTEWDSIGGTVTVVSSKLTVQEFEVNVATCLPGIKDKEDLVRASTDKAFLRKQIIELKNLRDFFQDVGDSAALKDLRERYTWLLRFYQSLQ